MIFGKYINRYYLKNAPVLLLGLLALLMVDYIQLLIPQFYRLVINGVNLGQVVVNGQTLPFTKEVLLQHICLPMIWIVLFMVVGRFLWRICFFGTSIRVQAAFSAPLCGLLPTCASGCLTTAASFRSSITRLTRSAT